MPRRKWKALVAVALVVLAIGVIAYLWTRGTDSRRDDALQACRAGNFAAAEPDLKELLHRDPNDVEVLNCLARGYFAQEKFADAEPYLSRLIELRPGNAEYLRQRMDVYRKLKQEEKAYADARKLLETDPADVEVRRLAMSLAFSAGQFIEAEEHCRTLLKEKLGDQDNRAVRRMLARVRQARGDDEGAGKILDLLIREDPNDYTAIFARGILYDQTGQPELAIPLLRRVFDEDRTRRRACGYQLGMALDKVGKHEEAEKVLAEVRRLQDVELFNEAIKSQPNNPELNVRLAEKLLREGNAADGVELLDSTLKRFPNYAPAHLALAAHYEKQGRADLAAKHRKLAGHGP